MRPGLTLRLVGLIRLVHPFPSILDGLVVAAVAIIAGGEPIVAARIGLAMTALQCSIGALNDLLDAPSDAGHRPGKPIPAGLVGPRAARVVAGGAALAGLALAAASGAGLLALSLVGLAIGYGYDLWAKGTAWSWLPFAVGIPLLPLFGWYGATGSVPAWFAALLPMAVLAGTSIAIANARADLERDEAASRTSVAVALGSERSWRVALGLLLVAVTLAVGWLLAAQAGSVALIATGAGAVVAVAGALGGRRADPATRQRAWEVQGVGTALVGVAWILAVAGQP